MVRHLGWVAGYIAILLFMAAGVFAGDGAVEFGDERLKDSVEWELGKDPTVEDMLKLQRLGYPGTLAPPVSVDSLKGLEYASNLRDLHLISSTIQDFSTLSQLTKLENLSLNECEISDLSPVVSAIESHPSLKHLSFRGNRISDISSLLKLQSAKIQWIDLKDNPLNEEAYKDVIAQLKKQIPSVEIYVPFRMSQLIVPGIFLAVLVIAGVLAVVRFWKYRGWGFELFSGLLSAGVGCFLGLLSHFLYGNERIFVKDGYENPLWAGAIAGGAFGLLAGLWFAQYLRGLSMKGYSQGRLIGEGILAGIGLGVICSTAVHVILMLSYRNVYFRPILTGLCFGISAGLLAGLVLSGCFIVGYKSGLIKGKEKV